MRKEIPPCTEHEVCIKHVDPSDVTREEVEFVLECMASRGVLEKVDDKYWFAEEYRDGRS